MTDIKAEAFLITFEENQLGHDIRILDEKATVADVVEALAAFARQRLYDCRGCDGCCYERAPLTSPDISALAALTPNGSNPAQAVCRAFAEISTDQTGIVDITLKRDADGACIFLDKESKNCANWPARPFVCRSHFCLPKSERLQKLREEITNRGENELIRLLLAEQAAGAPPMLPRSLRAADYPPDAAFANNHWENVAVKDIVPQKLWMELRK